MYTEILTEVLSPLTRTGVTVESQNERTTKRSQDWRVPGKTFKVRDSYLTEQYRNNPTIKTIRIVFWICFCTWAAGVVAQDYLNEKTSIKIPGIELMVSGLYNIEAGLLVWIGMILATLACYVSFCLWASLRSGLRGVSRRIFDYMSFVVAVAILVVFECLPIWVIFQFEFGCFLRAVLAGEKSRMMMKIFAFWVSKTPDVLEITEGKSKPRSIQNSEVNSALEESASEKKGPIFSSFAYFLFAPTFIYRDTYPRRKNIRWGFLALCIAETIGCYFSACALIEVFVIPTASSLASTLPVKLSTFFLTALQYFFIASMLFFLAMYDMLHSLQNTFGELLRFGDRHFISDWWNKTFLSEVFRTIDVPVQDFLYFYIYRPVYAWTGSWVCGQIVVFVLSMIEHEVIVSAGFGYCFPIVGFCCLGAGCLAALYLFPNNEFGRVVYLFSMTGTLSVIGLSYAVEYLARQNCHDDFMDSFWGQLIPRAFFCTK